MSLPLKIGLGFTGLIGASGVGYLGFRQFSFVPKESFKSKYSLAVKDFLNDDAILGKKLSVLEGDASLPKHSDLLTAKRHKKDKRDGDAKVFLKRGCTDIYGKSIDSGFIDDFKNYCAFNNGDKLDSGKTLVSENGDLNDKWASFSKKNIDRLYRGFKNVNKPENGQADESWKGSMLTECKNLSTEIFEGVISDFVEFCSKTV